MVSCEAILKVFSDYGRWTGQAINRNKCSVMFSNKVPRWKAHRLAMKLGVRCATEINYLGILLKLEALKARDFDKMLQSINSRLHGWGGRHLSMAGRIVLLNSVLLMSPVYLLSHCAVPNSVLQLAEKAARTYLWQGNDDYGMHYVAWDKVCRPKELGGLGIHSLIRWRESLLAQHAFWFINNPEGLLQRCLVARYGKSLDITNFKRADSVTWKLLCRGYRALASVLTWEVGDGTGISFFTDKWINGRSIMEWPTFINCYMDVPRLVAEFITEDCRWNMEKLGERCGSTLVNYISQVPINNEDGQDVVVLSNRFCGCSVSAFVYRSNWNEELWEFRWLWKLRLNPKEAVFWWRACNNALPTGAWRRRRCLGSDHSCPWGCEGLDDLPHIFIHCKFVTEVFRILGGWGFNVPTFPTLADLFFWLEYCSRHRARLHIANLVCSVLYLCWRNRNDEVHSRAYATPQMAANLFLSNITCGRQSPIKFWDTSALNGNHNPFSWCPPPDGWLKANFDGAFYPNGRGGFAMVIRDHLGNLVTAMGAPVRHWDCSAVEMMGFSLIKDILGHCTLLKKPVFLQQFYVAV